MASFLDILTRRVTAVRRKEHLAVVLQGLLLAVAAWLGLTVAALLAEQVFYMPPAMRTVLLWLIPLAGLALFAWRSGAALLRLLRIIPDEPAEQTAARIGEAFPAIRDRLVNAMQLSRQQASGSYVAYASPELLDAALADLHRDIEPLNLSSVVTYAGSRQAARMLGVVAGVLLLMFVVSPSSFFGSAYRLWHAGEVFAAPAPFRLLVEPGNKEVIKGETVRIIVHVEGAAPEQVVLASHPDGQTTDEERTILPSPDGIFRSEFNALKSSTNYHVRSGSVRSDQYRLAVVDRPLVRLLRVEVHPPAYTRLPAQWLDDNVGDVAALKGSRASFTIESNKELAEARLIFSDNTSVPLKVDKNHASGAVPVVRDRTYHLALADRDHVTNADPIEYTMKTLADAYPTVTILSPAANLDVTDNTTLPLLGRIADDYGFTRLRLAYKLVQSRYEQPAQEFTYVPIPIPAGTRAEATVPYQWQLSSLHLAPEDAVSYYLEVFDNDNVSGPKSALSEIFTLRLPSLDEVFADVDKGHEASLQNLQQSLEDAKQAKKDLDELMQEAKKAQQKMDWQDQKKAEQLVKKYDEMQKKLADVQQNVDKMTQEMQKNKVLSPETMEKYMELQQLMEQLNSPEMAEALKKLQQSMQQMSPEAMRQALEQMSFSEENFRKSIERTMNLLKRIQIEQKMDEAVRRAEQMHKEQQDVQKQTSQMNAGDKEKTDELAKQQQDLQKQAAEMAKQMQDLQKKMEEFPTEMPLSEMEKANRDMADSKLEQQLGEISRQLAGQQQQQAMQGQQQAMQKMGQFLQQLQSMKQAMQQNQQRQVTNEMRRAVQDMLELSQRQEALKNESRGLEMNSPRFRQNAEAQMEVMRDLANLGQRMSSLSQKTFAMTPEMGKAMGDAMRRMAESMKSLEQRSGGQASEQQQQAMASLNQGAQLMEGALEAMMQGGGQGMGMAGFLQRLRQMSGAQAGINQGTKDNQGLSQEQAAAMARLAAEQGAVRKSLEQLQREAASSGELKKMLGDLSKVAEEMREVQTDLAQGNVNPETVQKQDRILSRLLDAQRSTRERDFEKRRQSETGRDVFRQSPAAIDLTTQEGRNRLRRDLLKALEQGYSRDYEELIRKYFDALETEQQQGKTQE